MDKRFFTVVDSYGKEEPRHFNNKMVAKQKRNALNEGYSPDMHLYPRYFMEYGPDHKRNLKEQSDEKVTRQK